MALVPIRSAKVGRFSKLDCFLASVKAARLTGKKGKSAKFAIAVLSCRPRRRRFYAKFFACTCNSCLKLSLCDVVKKHRTRHHRNRYTRSLSHSISSLHTHTRTRTRTFKAKTLPRPVSMRLRHKGKFSDGLFRDRRCLVGKKKWLHKKVEVVVPKTSMQTCSSSSDLMLWCCSHTHPHTHSRTHTCTHARTHTRAKNRLLCKKSFCSTCSRRISSSSSGLYFFLFAIVVGVERRKKVKAAAEVKKKKQQLLKLFPPSVRRRRPLSLEIKKTSDDLGAKKGLLIVLVFSKMLSFFS